MYPWPRDGLLGGLKCFYVKNSVLQAQTALYSGFKKEASSAECTKLFTNDVCHAINKQIKMRNTCPNLQATSDRPGLD